MKRETSGSDQIVLKGVSYGRILTDINLTVEAGGYVGIGGPNGSGKSTLARIIKGVLTPSEGVVMVGGKIKNGGVIPEIGIVTANPENQLVSSSIEEDAAFGLENMNLPSEEIAARTEEALRWAGLWSERDVPAHHLSAGQQQMLVLAGTMAMRPLFLILDEATSLLGDEEKTRVLDSVRKMNREMGVGIIHISHDMEELLGAGTLYLLNGGKIEWCGPPHELDLQSDIVSSIGMDLPPIIQLKQMLINGGFQIDRSTVSVEKMADEIARLVVGRSGRGTLDPTIS